MDASPAWRPLPVAASHGAPALLVSTHFTRDSYAIHVTDLANIWSETLDRKAIYRRSLAEDTSIDPTDSTQNMQQFLSRIRSAFEPTHPDHPASRATLEASGDVLTLKITCEIPGLQPLKWPVHLGKSPASTLATELVLPLLQANLGGSRQVASLLEIIQQKDAVVGKLLDKLESTGTRLEHVFTTLPAKQKVTRKFAEDKIAGLAPFKQGRWRAELLDDQAHASPKDVPSLADAVFGRDGLEYRAGLDVYESPELDGWWKSLDGGIPITREEERPATPMAHKVDNNDNGDDDDDDFQVQSTPPHLSSAVKTRGQRDTTVQDDDATTEEDDPPPSPPREQKRGRIGAIGGKKRAPTPPPPAQQEGSETESEPASPKKPASPAPARPQKPVLGRIGGAKAKQRSKSPEAEAPPAEKPAPRRLGQIGRKPAAKAEDRTEEEQRGRRRDVETRVDPSPRETSEDRANRKRDELQRELEKKAAAGPARKKRRF